jgi:lipoyl(octanoyl) transferase
MNRPWYLLNSGPGEPALNMAIDEALLLEVARLERPVLRFYGWAEPAATFGYFQHYDAIARWTTLRPLIRRPTGGGLVSHLADWTYSIAIPPSHGWYRLKAEASYRVVHDWIRQAFLLMNIETVLALEARHDAPGQCFVGAEKNDLLYRGRKIAGAAQRRNRHGLLIQGSVQQPPAGASRESWQTAMREAGSAAMGTVWTEWVPDVLPLAIELAAQKYRQPAFNQKR